LFELGEGNEEFVVVGFIQVFREIGEDGNFGKDLNYFWCGDKL